MIGAWLAAVCGGRRFLLRWLVIALVFTQLQEGVRSQSSGKALEAVYDFYLDLGLARKYQASLILQGGRSLFSWGKPLEIREEQPDEFHVALGASDSLGSYTYTDRNKAIMYSHIPFQGKRSYQVCETLPGISWSFSEQTRQIGPYRCEKATGSFRGREYEVWFAPEQAVSIGPWKLHGLPGLVVEARDRLGEIVFRLNTLKPYYADLRVVEQREDCLDIVEFALLQKEWAQELLRRMNAKLPRGSRLSLGSQNTMERFEGQQE